MKTDSTILIAELLEIAKQDYQSVKNFQNLFDTALNHKPATNGWSILECLEHLNLYTAFYLPEIEKEFTTLRLPQQIFKSGIVGNMLINMVKPVESSKKMKTFKAMNPDGEILGREVLTTFINNQTQLITLLEKAGNTNLNKRCIAVHLHRSLNLKQAMPYGLWYTTISVIYFRRCV